MCDNCNCQEQEQELEQVEQYEEETVDDRLVNLTLEKEYDRLSRQLMFTQEDIDKLSLTPEFLDGSKEALKLCGMYSTLLSFGFDDDKAWELVINSQNIQYNLAATKINADMNIEVSKQQSIVADKNAI